MENDAVTLIKPDGKRFEKIRANVQPTIIFISDADLPIEEDDIIERPLRNGLVERYLVIDRGFWDTGNMPAHYQCKVIKEAAARKAAASGTVIYNIYGHNSKVNIHSTDNSISIVNAAPEELFTRLHDVIQEKIQDNQDILEVVRAMQQNIGRPTFFEKYQEFIGLTANIMTIVGPFLPALTQLIKF
jgi:hypothetical protein